jgi:hypothetical protein
LPVIFHSSCAKKPTSFPLTVMSDTSGTRIDNRSGYVRGSLGLKSRSLVENVKVPFWLSAL